MKTTIINGYHVAGNEYLAIAINVEDPKDAHYFIPVKIGMNNAYDQTIWWTGLDPEVRSL